jgi:hypothetical protein
MFWFMRSMPKPRCIPCRRSCAISARSLSRITVLPGVQREEVAGHLFEEQRLEAAEIKQAVLQRLFDGGDERTAWVGPLQADQAAQCAPAPPVAALLESGNVSVETGVMAAQQGLFACRATVLSNRDGMMAGQGVPGIARADQPPVHGDRDILAADTDLGGRLVDGDRLADEALGDGVAIGIDRNVAVQIDDAFKQFVNRRQSIGQRPQVRLLDDKAASADMPSARFGL